MGDEDLKIRLRQSGKRKNIKSRSKIIGYGDQRSGEHEKGDGQERRRRKQKKRE